MSLWDRIRARIARVVPRGGTSQQVVKGGAWLASQNVVARIFQLAMLAVLARLIGPHELGIVGIALLALGSVRKFTNIGLDAALVQKEDENVDTHLDTTWVLEIGRGILIGSVLVAAGPFVADVVFNAPRAGPVIQVVGLSPIILGFRNPGVVYFQKKLNFHKQFAYRVGGDAGQFVVATAWALVSPTAWAFVAGFLAADVIRFVISYTIHEYRPSINFKLDTAKDLIGYGKWLTGSSILYFLYSQGDDAFVGWMLTPTALAYYQYTYRFSNAPATELSQVLSQVLFPAYSKLQSDVARLRDGFLRALRVTALVAFPASVGIAAIAPTFMLAFFGEEWMPAVPAMQVLAVYGLFRAMGRTFGPVWKAIGRPDYITKLSALRVVLLAIIIYPLTDWYGILGTAIAVTSLYAFPMMPLDIYITAREVETSVWRICYEFLFPAIASAAMGLGVWYVQSVLSLSAFLELPILVVLGVVLYSGLVLLLEAVFNWEVTPQFRSIFRSLAS